MSSQSQADENKHTQPRHSARLAWIISTIIVALCLVIAIAALWVFDVIALPWAGRFPLPARNASAVPQQTKPQAQPKSSLRFLGKTSSNGSWPPVSGAQPLNARALSHATHDFLSQTGSPIQEGFVIANGGKEVVSSSHPDQLLEPASTMKTLTALAASSVLDMNRRLATDTILLPPSRQSNRVLVLRGGGDMLLRKGHNDPTHVNGRAGLATLADQTAASLRHRKIGQVLLVADTSLFGPARRPAKMGSDYVRIGYFAPTSALAVDEGRKNAPGDPDTLAHTTCPRVGDPAGEAVETFARLLSADGVKLANGRTGKETFSVPSASTAQQNVANASGKPFSKKPFTRFTKRSTKPVRVGRISSAPLREILAFELQVSDNTLSEELGRLAALQLGTGNSPAGAVKAVKEELARQGIALTGAKIADCCGLSPGSRLTPRMLFQVMQRLVTHAPAAVLRGMPVLTGRNPSYPPQAAGRVILKSGSLDEVVSLSGIILRTNGGFFVYSVIINVPEGEWNARSRGYTAMYELASKLVTL